MLDGLHTYRLQKTWRVSVAALKRLASVGMRLLEVFDRRGRVVSETEDDSENLRLLYVEQREASAGSRQHKRKLFGLRASPSGCIISYLYLLLAPEEFL